MFVEKDQLNTIYLLFYNSVYIMLIIIIIPQFSDVEYYFQMWKCSGSDRGGVDNVPGGERVEKRKSQSRKYQSRELMLLIMRRTVLGEVKL